VFLYILFLKQNNQNQIRKTRQQRGGGDSIEKQVVSNAKKERHVKKMNTACGIFRITFSLTNRLTAYEQLKALAKMLSFDKVVLIDLS